MSAGGILAEAHQRLRPRTYLEVGVRHGRSLALARPGTATIGVDPDPDITVPLGPHVQVFAETSDKFFALHDVRELLGGRPVELALIDGLHHADVVLRDFVNVERLCAPHGVILIDDTSPPDEASARRERLGQVWAGDVWKAVVVLRRYRPDLEIATLAVPPAGLTVVWRLDPGSNALTDADDAVQLDLAALDYDAIADESRRRELLNLVPGGRPAVFRQIERPRGRSPQRLVRRLAGLCRQVAG